MAYGGGMGWRGGWRWRACAAVLLALTAPSLFGAPADAAAGDASSTGFRPPPAAPRQSVPADVRVAGQTLFRGRTLPYTVTAGRALVEGDIDIGPAEAGSVATATANGTVGTQGLPLADVTRLWPKVGGVARVPYTVDVGNAAVADALAQFNAALAGVVQWVPRTAEADWVAFELDPADFSGTGYSWVGRKGGRQVIGGSVSVVAGTLLHEMGHAIGLQHEHSRADRDAQVRVIEANVIKSLQPNFDVVTDAAQTLGLYDLASLMHYPAYVFSKNGQPTLETVPPGIPLGELATYSAGDLDTIRRRYGVVPTALTLSTNPPGLQIVVDGVTVTTPHAVNWPLDSLHTLEVPMAPQRLGDRVFVFGRWGDRPERQRPYTAARGNGLAGAPTNRPAVTALSAHFVELVPYAPYVWPEGAGSVSASPAPQAYPPLEGLYHVKGQPVTLQASASAGYGLYRLYTADGPVSQNPKTTRSPEWVLAYFTPQQRTTVSSTPAGRWVWVDGAFWQAPVTFSPYYDSGWTPGSTHTLDVAVSPQLPYSYSIRYPFTGWSNGGAQSHTFTVPSFSNTVTAGFGREYLPRAWAQQPCAGSVALAPFSADGFLPAGSTLQATQTPQPGWTFTGWQEDATGRANPTSLTMSDERLLIATYNTSPNALTLTGFSPVNRTAGQGAFTLRINGTGFTAATRVFVRDAYRAPTSVTATQLQVAITAAEAATAGALPIQVDNVPAGTWNCSAYAVRPFFLRSASQQPLAQATPSRLVFAAQAVGSTSAPSVVTLRNGGALTLAVHDVAVTGTHAADFLLTRLCASSLAPAATCTVEVRFRPGATGSRSAQLLWVDTAGDSPQKTVLSGTGGP